MENVTEEMIAEIFKNELNEKSNKKWTEQKTKNLMTEETPIEENIPRIKNFVPNTWIFKKS